jgi:hypothetical protein
MQIGELIAHRVNTIGGLRQVPRDYGVEVDLRDRGERLILQHEPFADGEDFAPYLREYRHGTLILNVKSERIEHRVIEEVQAAGTVERWFFLDCSFSMIRTLVELGEHRIAVRFSEFEPIEAALALAGEVEWVWVDCFTRLPLDAESYGRLKEHFKLCLVSPELQGYGVERIGEFAQQLRGCHIDAVCTKRPDLWRSAADSVG